jgi:hypothetical protein
MEAERMSEAKPMDPGRRATGYRESMRRTHAGRRSYTRRQMRRMRHKENRLAKLTGDLSVRIH